MKSRLIMLMSLCIAAASVLLTAHRVYFRFAAPPPVHVVLPAKAASYLGVFESGTPSGYSAVAGFSQVAGRLPNLAGYYSGWAEPFDSAFADSMYSHGVRPLIQIDPSDASISAIADGTYDQYLRSYADGVRAYGHAVVIGFGHEMNAPWYSWGYGHVKPAEFVAAWRHVVTIFRQEGADNVTWLWTVQSDQPGTGPIRDWWPGDAYVTWVGIDGFFVHRGDTFAQVFGPTIAQVHQLTSKQILISETAVAPASDQFLKIVNLFSGMAKAKALGLIWFDINQQDGRDHQDWRLEKDPTGSNAFRFGVRSDLTG